MAVDLSVIRVLCTDKQELVKPSDTITNLYRFPHSQSGPVGWDAITRISDSRYSALAGILSDILYEFQVPGILPVIYQQTDIAYH